MTQFSALNTSNQQSAVSRLAEPTVIQTMVITDSKDTEICVSDTKDNSRDHIKNDINSAEHKNLNNKQKIKMIKQKEEYLDR